MTSWFRGEYPYADEPAPVSLPAASYVTARDTPFSTTALSFGVLPRKDDDVDRHVPSEDERMLPMES